MTPERAAEIRFYACERKHAFPNYDTAHKQARHDSRPYRCPFCRRIHVGRSPSLKTIRSIAQAIRVLHQEATR